MTDATLKNVDKAKIPYTLKRPIRSKDLLLNVPIMIITGTILLMFVIFRQLLSILLRMWYGERFGGMMSPADSIWMAISNPVIHALLVYDSEIETAHEFSELVYQHNKTLWDGNQNTRTKIRGIHKSFLGYTYYLKDVLTVRDCHRVLNLEGIDKDYLDQSDLTDILSDLDKIPLPHNNRGLCQILTLSKPLKTEGNANRYVVIVRVNHAFADGLSGIYYLFRGIATNRVKFDEDMASLMSKFGIAKSSVSEKGILKKLKYFFKISYFLAFAPSFFIKDQIFRKFNNCLHGPELSGEKYLVYSTERPGEHLMDAVRRIKRDVPEATFSGIIATAISRALEMYFQANCEAVPEILIGGIIGLYSLPNVNGNLKLENNISVGPVVLTLPRGRERVSIQEQVKRVTQQMNLLKNNTPYLMVKYLTTTHFTGYFPNPIQKILLDKEVSATFTLSNIPGFPSTPTYGHETRDFYFFAPHYQRVGVGFNILTYQDKFRIGLVVDRVLIPEKKAAQELVDSIIKELRLMYEEYKLTICM